MKNLKIKAVKLIRYCERSCKLAIATFTDFPYGSYRKHFSLYISAAGGLTRKGLCTLLSTESLLASLFLHLNDSNA